MINRQTLAPAMLALLLFSPPMLAQEADEATAADDKDATASKPAPRQPETVPAASEESPYDYRSSEEISEDLSVSFPVDI